MTQTDVEIIDMELGELAKTIPDDSGTAHLIRQNAGWGEISDCARAEGFSDIAEVAAQAQSDWDEDDES
jgi:hypothetical protein